MLSVPLGVALVGLVLSFLGALQLVGLAVVGVYRLLLAREQRGRARAVRYARQDFAAARARGEVLR